MGCDIHMIVEVRKSAKEPWRPVSRPGYGDRNYDLFAILANVRNRHGFEPIAEPRGLPDDISHEDNWAMDEDGERVWLGDHSYTWLTLAEILGFDWDKKITIRAWVGAEDYVEWKRNGKPTEWNVYGPSVTCTEVPQEKMEQAIAGDWIARSHMCTLVEWQNTYRQEAADFLEWAETLHRLGEPSNVRLVFGFDS